MSKLKQKYGFWAAFAMTLTATIGSSLLISFNYVMFLSEFSPVFLIIAWAIGGLIIIPENLIMIEPAVSFKTSGTAYSWVRRAGWRVVGFWFGWVLVLMVSAAAVASVSVGLGQIVLTLANALSGWTMNMESKGFVWGSRAIGIAILIILALVQIYIKNSNKYSQYVFSILTVLPVIFILIVAMALGNWTNMFSREASQAVDKSMGQLFISSGLLIPAITFTSYAYSGTEISTYVTEEIKEPEKTIPKVVIGAIIFIICVYIIYGFALLSLSSPKSLGDPTNPVPWNLNIPKGVQIAFEIMAILLFAGSINAFLVYQTALVFKLSEERDLFSTFTKTTKNNVPYMSMIFLISVAIIYILTNNLFNIIAYFTLAVSCLKITMVTSATYLRIKDKEYKKIWSDKWYYTFLVLAYITCALTFIGAILALFMMYPKDKATSELIFQIIFLVVLLALMPVGYIKYYFQDKIDKKQKLEKS